MIDIQPSYVLARRLASSEAEDSVAANSYCPHALADGNYRIWISRKTLEFSSTMSPAPSLYLAYSVKALRRIFNRVQVNPFRGEKIERMPEKVNYIITTVVTVQV